MKKILLLLGMTFALCSANLNAQIDDNWAEVGNAAYNSTLSSMVFISPETGYAVGSGGSFLKTENGGITWTAVDIGYQFNFKKIVFLNSQKGFLIGDDPLSYNQVNLLQTLNGGSSWSPVSFGDGESNGSELYFFNESIGFVAGNEWYYKTTDGGATWVYQSFTGVYQIFNMLFLNENKGFIMANGGGYVTDDGGDTWTKFLNSPRTAIQFTDALTGYIANYSNYDYQKSTDGGITWNPIPKPSVSYSDKLFFVDNNIGFAFSSQEVNIGQVAKTSDGGLTWNTIMIEPKQMLNTMIKHQNKLFTCGRGGIIMESDDMEEFNLVQEGLFKGKLNDICFVDENTALAVGEQGVIVKTTDKGSTWSRISSGVTTTLWSICSTSANVFYAVGNNSILIKSTDGGNTWVNSNNGFFSENFRGEIRFSDANTGYVAYNIVYKTTDAGASWTEVMNTQPFCNSISIPHPDTLFVVGTSIMRSVDAGTTWVNLGGASNIFYGTDFLDGKNGLLAQEYRKIYATHDAGDSWLIKDFEEILFYDVKMTDPLIWYGIGSGGSIVKTTDGGITWNDVISGTGRSLYDIAFGPDGTGYILGEDGIILRKAIVETYTLTFNVTKQSGGAVNDATITLNDFGYPAGHYVFEGLLPGDYTWKVQRSGYCDEEGSFELTANTTENVVLGTCFEVIVNVTDYENNELEGASVTLGTESKVTNNLGRVFFTLSSAGSYDISIQKAGFQTFTNTVNLSGGITLNYALLLEILPPEALFANNITNLTFTARWVKPENATTCLLYVSDDDFATHIPGFDGLPVSVTQYTIEGLEPDKTYKYRLKGKNGEAESGYSNIIEVRTALHGLFDDETIGRFSVQPNPAKDYITINLPDKMQNASYYISNCIGVVMVSDEINSTEEKLQLNISHLPEGLYTMLISSADRKFVSKFIKVK